jgi:Ras and EF-hand domain-containing protein
LLEFAVVSVSLLAVVKETVEDETVIVVIGNKLDMAEDKKDVERVISSSHGKQLANEYGALFFETSAKSGLNVAESIQQMARLLRDREDKEIRKVQDLTTCTLDKPQSTSDKLQQKCCNF